MFGFTLRQLRMSLRQVAGGAMAIVVATGFIAAAMAGSAVMNDTVDNIMREPYAGADLVMGRADYYDAQYLPPTAADDVLADPAVADAFRSVTVSAEASADKRSEWVTLRSASNAPAFATWPVGQGREPSSLGEASLAESLAKRLRVGVGDQIELAVTVFGDPVATDLAVAGSGSDELAASAAPVDAEEAAAAVAEPAESVTALTVTGLFDDSAPTFLTSRPNIQTTPETLALLGVDQANADYYTPGALLIDLAAGVEDSPQVRQQIFDTVSAAWQGTDWAAECPEGFKLLSKGDQWRHGNYDLCSVLVMSPREAGSIRSSQNFDSAVLTGVVVVFGLVSLLTGAMVIANTFQVMIAGRARTLALLRAVGATRSQVHRSVLTEAIITGLVASGIGVVAGWGLVTLALTVATRLYPTIPLPVTAHMSFTAVAAAALIGSLTTILASLVPANMATRVAPIEALRPQAAPTLAARSGRKRLIWSIVLAALGAVGLALSVVLVNVLDSGTIDPAVILVCAVAGVLSGGAMAAGVIIGSVFWLPKLVGRIAGQIARRPGGARIAAANVVRNPRRTAAAATALMVGVTLVGSMLVAAATFDRSIDAYVGRQAPIDLGVGYARGGYMTDVEEVTPHELIGEAVPADLVHQIENVPGITASAPITATTVQIEDDLGVEVTYFINGVDPARLASTLAESDIPAQLAPNVVLVDSFTNDQLAQMSEFESDQAYSDSEWTPPSPNPISGSTRAVLTRGGESFELTFVYAPELDSSRVWLGSMITDQATLDALGADQTVLALFDVDAEADAVAVQNEVLELVTDASPQLAAYEVQGSAIEKAEARKALSTMLLIGLALLAVSLVVALIGISNTLSLSVIERRHETALLRALGLSKGQTRWMLAVEAMVIAGVAGLMGVAFGALYGFAASALLLGPTFGAEFAFPIWPMAVLFGLILAAGLLASVLPGRRAARTPPAAALAIE
ncbi:MAG: ABC transporter permease [Bifidobacteriaceae bacterium]|jgi:putative ABC transport system permease protein|nr:ABC transporter permease [Bifidobacteriaceae bacterium]